MHWTNEILSKPWKANTRGPETFDCWGLVHYVYLTQKGIDLPSYLEVNANNRKETTSFIERLNSNSSCWKQISIPENFCVCAMSMSDLFSHVGLWLNVDGGIVIHCTKETGVIAEPIRSLKTKGWRKICFFLWQP